MKHQTLLTLLTIAVLAGLANLACGFAPGGSPAAAAPSAVAPAAQAPGGSQTPPPIVIPRTAPTANAPTQGGVGAAGAGTAVPGTPGAMPGMPGAGSNATPAAAAPGGGAAPTLMFPIPNPFPLPGGLGSKNTPPATAGQTTTPAAEITASPDDIAEIKNTFPETSAGECQNYNPQAVPHARAIVLCMYENTADVVLFMKMESAAMSAAVVDSVGNQPNGSLKTWHQGQDQQSLGRIAQAKNDKGDAELVWNFDGSPMLGFGVRRDGDQDALYRWWTGAGSTGSAGGGTTGGQTGNVQPTAEPLAATPTQSAGGAPANATAPADATAAATQSATLTGEQTAALGALRAHFAAIDDQHCQPHDTPVDGVVATLDCHFDLRGIDVFYEKWSSADQMQNYLAELAKEYGGTVKDWVFGNSGPTAGSYVLFTSQNTAYIFWTENANLMAGYASMSDTTDSLKDWWSNVGSAVR